MRTTLIGVGKMSSGRIFPDAKGNRIPSSFIINPMSVKKKANIERE